MLIGAMAENPTTGDLFKAKAITSDEVDAAVDAVLAKPEIGAYPIGGGYLLDLGVATKAHKPTVAALADLGGNVKHRRIMVRTAILLARPEKV